MIYISRSSLIKVINYIENTFLWKLEAIADLVNIAIWENTNAGWTIFFDDQREAPMVVYLFEPHIRPKSNICGLFEDHGFGGAAE